MTDINQNSYHNTATGTCHIIRCQRQHTPDLSLLTELRQGDWLLIDSADAPLHWQVLSWARPWHRSLRRHARRGVNMLLTRHRRGCLPVVHRHEPSEEIMIKLLQDLVPQSYKSYLPTAQAAFSKHRGNLREVWRACYFHAASIQLCSNIDS